MALAASVATLANDEPLRTHFYVGLRIGRHPEATRARTSTHAPPLPAGFPICGMPKLAVLSPTGTTVTVADEAAKRRRTIRPPR
ncbi:MAG: hypothetical protein QOF54_2286 [Solirubrobacteraceae bacterium]|jgi:hypothetical protein|nr:hypothetical protein [Solirubrobacteraceae bacterium]